MKDRNIIVVRKGEMGSIWGKIINFLKTINRVYEEERENAYNENLSERYYRMKKYGKL